MTNLFMRVYITLAAAVAVWMCYKIATLIVASQNLDRYRERAIRLLDDLESRGEMKLHRYYNDRIISSLENMADGVWRLKDMVPPDVYFAIYPYLYEEDEDGYSF